MLIGISGKLYSGKDTAAAIIREQYPNLAIKKFADKVKDIVCLILNCTREQLEDQDFKSKKLGEKWIKMLPNIGFTQPPIQHQLTIRDILIGVGDGMRNEIHPDIWVNSLFNEYLPIKKENGFSRIVKNEEGIPIDYEYEIEYPNWIITDVRYPNEAKMIKNNGGIIIRINRDNEETKLRREPTKMSNSECSLDNYKDFDYIINNNGTLEELKSHIKLLNL